jgi:hypothetical protein
MDFFLKKLAVFTQGLRRSGNWIVNFTILPPARLVPLLLDSTAWWSSSSALTCACRACLCPGSSALCPRAQLVSHELACTRVRAPCAHVGVQLRPSAATPRTSAQLPCKLLRDLHRPRAPRVLRRRARVRVGHAHLYARPSPRACAEEVDGHGRMRRRRCCVVFRSAHGLQRDAVRLCALPDAFALAIRATDRPSSRCRSHLTRCDGALFVPADPATPASLWAPALFLGFFMQVLEGLGRIRRYKNHLETFCLVVYDILFRTSE